MSFDQAFQEALAPLVERIEQLERLHATSTSQEQVNLPEVMDAHQVAEALGCSRQHVNTLGRTGALRRKADGNRYLYLREWVIDYVRSSQAAPPMPAKTRRLLHNRRAVRASEAAA